MFNRIIPYVALMFIGVIGTSCEQTELEEVATENITAVEKATSANILIEETFEGSSPLSTFHGKEILPTSYSFQVVGTPVYDGSKAGRIELRDSDPLESNGTRAEMVVIKDKMQKEMWFSFSAYFPAEYYQNDSKPEIISQWHQSGGTSPPSYLEIQNDALAFEVANKTDGHVRYELGKLIKNQWQQFTFHYIQSNGTDGLVEIWHNGNKVVTHKGGNIYALSNLPKWKVGIYKWKWNGTGTTDVSKRVAFFDNIRVGTSKATLAEMMATSSAVAPTPTTETTTTTTTPTTTTPTTTTTTTTAGPTFTFVNAAIDRDYKALTNGSSLSLSAMGTPKVNIRANYATTVGSVKFVVTGAKSYTYIDNAKPFALFGDDGNGNYYYGSYLPVGSYTMTVTPYSGLKGTGTAGTPTTVKFTIAN
jgi:Polysaccharide lyase